jgi:hypothetical protein
MIDRKPLSAVLARMTLLATLSVMPVHAQDASIVIQRAIAATHTKDVESLQVTGRGFNALFGQPTPKLVLPAGVERLCSIQFDQDQRRPARVEDSALSCLKEVAKVLKARPDRKLVLVAVSDPVKDHEEKDAGMERETEDRTGLDIRYEDTSAYRAVNTKWYLTHFLGIAPSRILPTTNEARHGQEVRFYLVPGDADFLHNYLNTTRTNEAPCTVKPCYDKREETVEAQPRNAIQPQSAR